MVSYPSPDTAYQDHQTLNNPLKESLFKAITYGRSCSSKTQKNLVFVRNLSGRLNLPLEEKKNGGMAISKQSFRKQAGGQEMSARLSSKAKIPLKNLKYS